MISESCLEAYYKLYPKGSIHYHVSSGNVHIEVGKKSFSQPPDETDETFMERLSRCTKDHNVFAEEWPEFHYIPGVLY